MKVPSNEVCFIFATTDHVVPQNPNLVGDAQYLHRSGLLCWLAATA